MNKKINCGIQNKNNLKIKLTIYRVKFKIIKINWKIKRK